MRIQSKFFTKMSTIWFWMSAHSFNSTLHVKFWSIKKKITLILPCTHALLQTNVQSPSQYKVSKRWNFKTGKQLYAQKNQSSNILMDPMGQHEPLLSHVQYTYCYCRCVFTKTCLKFVQWKDTLSTDCHRTIYLLNICNTTMSLWFTLSQGMTYEKLLWWNGHQKMVVPA